MSSRFHRNVLTQAVALALTTAYAGTGSANPAAGSPYFTDVQNTHVEDATSKSIGTVNMIACIMHAMAADQLVNQGNYIALVDENACDPTAQSSTSQSGSNSGSQTNYTTSIVNSSRASNNDPMQVKAWLDENQDGQAMTIFVNVSATAAPSDTNPYGVFRLDFCGHPDSASDATCMMNGFLNAQDGALSFYQAEGGGGFSSTTALQLSSVGTTSGSGQLAHSESDGSTTVNEDFAFAYDQNFFLRGDQCFSRDASDPATGQSVWRYGLYDATTGERIDLNSGFPIQYTMGGVTYQGFLGYWGLSLPPGAGDIQTGTTVQKVDYGSGGAPTVTDYTVVKAGGKLTKFTRKSTTLDQLDQIALNAWVNDPSSFDPNAVGGGQYEMYWDDAAGDFKVTGKVVCGNNGCQTTDFQSAQDAAASVFANQGGLQGWSQALGGEVFIALGGATGTIDSSIIAVNYRVQDIVYPADMPATLYCVNDCPTASSMAGFFVQGSNATSPFVAATFNNWNPTTLGNVVTYAADPNNAVLLDANSAPVTFTSATALQAQPMYSNGIRSGRLFASLAAAECSTGSGTYCDYKVGEADVYYQWETGSNNWNQFAAVKDGNGNVVHFDPPLQVNYQVPNGAQYGQYAGKTIVLQYGGFGNLWGIPGSCVSRLTNQTVSCDNQDARYVPEFVIPVSDTTGVVTAGSTQYLVKWLDREIRFALKDISQCSGLTVPTNVTLPSSVDLQNPADPASGIYIGAKPEVTDAPRVIQGDVKY